MKTNTTNINTEVNTVSTIKPYKGPETYNNPSFLVPAISCFEVENTMTLWSCLFGKHSGNEDESPTPLDFETVDKLYDGALYTDMLNTVFYNDKQVVSALFGLEFKKKYEDINTFPTTLCNEVMAMTSMANKFISHQRIMANKSKTKGVAPTIAFSLGIVMMEYASSYKEIVEVLIETDELYPLYKHELPSVKLWSEFNKAGSKLNKILMSLLNFGMEDALIPAVVEEVRLKVEAFDKNAAKSKVKKVFTFKEKAPKPIKPSKAPKFNQMSKAKMIEIAKKEQVSFKGEQYKQVVLNEMTLLEAIKKNNTPEGKAAITERVANTMTRKAAEKQLALVEAFNVEQAKMKAAH